jgi:hypothetical protein
MSDFDNIPEVVQLVNGNINSELAFTYPAVLDVLAVCAKNRIAVLGVEIFQVVEGQRFQARGFSAYVFAEDSWEHFVGKNNSAAKEFIKKNPVGDDCVYLLTTASKQEFANLRRDP